MKSSRFKRLAWLVGILMVAIIIAGIAGFASQRWFEITAGIYIAAGIGIMFLPVKK